MSITKNSLLVFLFAIIVVFILYFYGGLLIDSVIKEKFNLNEWPGFNNLGWVPAIIIFSVGVIIGLLLFRRKI